MLTEAGKGIHEHSENFNKKLGNNFLKKQQSELKNNNNGNEQCMTESRSSSTKELTSDQEDRITKPLNKNSKGLLQLLLK